MRSPAAVAAAVSVALHVAVAIALRVELPRGDEDSAAATDDPVILEVSLAVDDASALAVAEPVSPSAAAMEATRARQPGSGVATKSAEPGEAEASAPGEPADAASRMSLSMRGESSPIGDLDSNGESGPTVAVDPGGFVLPGIGRMDAPAPGAGALGNLGEPAVPGESADPLAEDAAAYTARVDDDGRVTFRDRPNLHINLPSLGAVGSALERWADDPYAYQADSPVPGITGGFDITDAILRARGEDPYSASKLRFLDRTRNQRMAIAEVAAERDRRAALHALPAELVRIWSSPELPIAERKRILFLLWDECAERGSPALVTAGARARATILAFVRRRVPAGSVHAYTAAELAALNRGRSSTAVFDPY